jgi:hypothetical protein
MTTQTRKPRNLGRSGAAAFLLLLAASATLAISANGKPGQRRRAMRESQIRVMDIFAQNYGGADWSPVTSDLESHPADPANTAFMSIPLSLGNVYLNRYEVGWNKADLERSLGMFEWVASNRELWGGREGSGSVVSYLDISLTRLRAECDVGGFESRIEELWRTAMAITEAEAQALLQAIGEPDRPCRLESTLGACTLRILPVDSEQRQASRASLLAAASSFLPDDPRSPAWGESARRFAVAAPDSSFSACEAAEADLVLAQGALSYRLAGGDIPSEFGAVSGTVAARRTASSCPSFLAYRTTGPVEVVEPGDSLATALADSRVVAFYLLERFLWQFPPGSQCEGDDEDGNVVREPRML